METGPVDSLGEFFHDVLPSEIGVSLRNTEFGSNLSVAHGAPPSGLLSQLRLPEV